MFTVIQLIHLLNSIGCNMFCGILQKIMTFCVQEEEQREIALQFA